MHYRALRSAPPLRLALGVGASIVAVVVLFLLDRNDDSADSIAADPDATISSASPPPVLESVESVAAAEIERRDLTIDDVPSPVDLDRCDRDLDLFGIVVDASGAPIAGAELTTASFPRARTSLMDVDSRLDVVFGPSTRSALDGTFSLRLSRGACVNLTARHPGFATTTTPHWQAGERVRLVLHPAARLVIESVDESGAAVEGVKIKLWRMASTGFDHREGVSGTDGRVSFEDLSPGTTRAQLDHAVLGQPDWQTISIEAGAILVKRVTLPTGRTIRGRVTDRLTGKPIAGASVGSNWVCDRPARTDVEGHYVFPGWTGTGTVEMTALASGYGRKTLRVDDLDRLDFALDPGDRVIGRLVGADEAPVGDARVHAIASSIGTGEQEIDTIAGRSLSDGSYLLEGLRRDLSHTLVVLASGHGRYLLDFHPHPERAGTIDVGTITLPSARAISGLALDAAGAPLAGVRVSLSGNNADRNRLVGPIEPINDFYGRSESRRTDDLGRFRFPDLSPGDYQVSIRPEGEPKVEVSVSLPADRDLDGIELRTSRGADFVARVVTEDGTPIEGAWVTTYSPYVSSETDTEGLAVLKNLPPILTQFTVSPGRTGLRIDPISAVPDGREVRIVARSIVEITGRVVDEHGTPIPGIGVSIVRGARSSMTFTDPKGTFQQNATHGERVDLVLSGDSMKLSDEGVTQTESSELRGRLLNVVAPATRLEIVARPAIRDRTVSALVLDPEGRPAPKAVVFLTRSDGVYCYENAQADGEGRVKFERLEAGEYAIHARIGHHEWVESETIGVQSGDEPVTLRLRRGAPVAGIVYDSSGAPGGGASVVVHRPGNRQVHRSADEHGRFRFAALPGETLALEVSIRRSNGTTERARVESVIPGEPELAIRLVK